MLAKPVALVIIEGIDRRENAKCFSMDSGFFQKFANRRRLDRFSILDFSAREAPASGIGRIGTTHQKDSAFVEDGGDGRRHRPDWRQSKEAVCPRPFAGTIRITFADCEAA